MRNRGVHSGLIFLASSVGRQASETFAKKTRLSYSLFDATKLCAIAIGTMMHFSQMPVAAAKWIHREAVAARPVFIFFAIGFLLELLLIKLALAQFSIPLTALSKAVVGALFAAKAVLILDETSLARRLESYRRIIAVAVKTLLYGGCAMMLVFLERFIEALRRVGLDGAGREVLKQATVYRMLAWVLGISIVFGIYFACFEINQNMGDGALWSLFFRAPDSVPTGHRSA